MSDPALREQYRDRFGSASGKYQLSVPFTERCFDLAEYGERPGYVGMITSNAFMKRSFGRKLVERYFPLWDITHVIDTSGVYLPGHGTPTAILFGRNCLPAENNPIRVVRGIRGETQPPDDPAHAPVWTPILKQIDRPGSESKCISVADAERISFHQHPWPIGGGGAAELKERLDDSGSTQLRKMVTSIGYASFPGMDDPFVISSSAMRARFGESPVRPFLFGEKVSDWFASLDAQVLAPYNDDYELLELNTESGWCRCLWPFRTSLLAIVSFVGKTRRQLGASWWRPRLKSM